MLPECVLSAVLAEVQEPKKKLFVSPKTFWAPSFFLETTSNDFKRFVGAEGGKRIWIALFA